MIIRTYDQRAYDFPADVRRVLGVPDLSDLHRYYDPPEPLAGDQGTAAHTAFYRAFPELEDLYQDFLRENILPLFPGPVCFQRVPTLRVGFPGGTAVSAFHRDSDYNHQSGTVNYWAPLTPAFASNTIWIESAPDLGDYRPVNLEPGRLLEFDATLLTHGNKSNSTGKTRVSFDFRVIPLSNYRSRGLSTVSSRTRLEIGAYFLTMSADGKVSDSAVETHQQNT